MRVQVRKNRSESLCDTCSHGQRTEALGGAVVRWCHNMYPALPVYAAIEECSAYQFEFAEAPHHMREIAWVIDVDNRAEFVGFRAPKKKKPEDE